MSDRHKSEWAQELLARRNIPQRTPEWFNAREGRLTASDVPAAVGENEHMTPAALLKRKLKPGSFKGSPATAHGSYYEDHAARKFEEATGEIVHECGLFVHEDEPWLAGSPDGVCNNRALVEIKCPFRRAIDPGIVPQQYVGQIQTCMEICDADHCWFIQYVPETTWTNEILDIVKVPRDRQWFEKNLKVMRDFHDQMLHAKLRATEEPEANPKPAKRARTAKTRSPPECQLEHIPHYIIF